MSSPIGFQRPNLHLSESLSSKLSLSPQRLLSNEGIWASRPSMYLILHKVNQLHHVHITHRNRLVERLACAAIIQGRFAIDWRRHPLLLTHFLHLLSHFSIRKSFGIYTQLPQPELEASLPGLAAMLLVQYSITLKPLCIKPRFGFLHFSSVVKSMSTPQA